VGFLDYIIDKEKHKTLFWIFLIVFMSGAISTIWLTSWIQNRSTSNIENGVKYISQQNDSLKIQNKQLISLLQPFQNQATNLYPTLETNEALKEFAKHIEDLQLKTNIISSLELRASIYAKTAPSTPSGEGVNMGRGSVIALFTQDKKRYRFVTDGQYKGQQISSNEHRFSFVYKPEDPAQILGKQIDYLKNMKVLGCDYSEFLRGNNEPSGLELKVLLNGVEVVNFTANAEPGVLSKGEALLDVGKYFEDIANSYEQKIVEQSK
jgi:hypothetical protein